MLYIQHKHDLQIFQNQMENAVNVIEYLGN